MSVWTREPDAARAASVADAILDMRPSPEDWIAGWSGNPPPEWIESVRQVMAAGLVMPFEIDGEEAMAAYNEWLERRILAPLRVAAPDHYQALVGHIKAFIATSWKDQDD